MKQLLNFFVGLFSSIVVAIVSLFLMITLPSPLAFIQWHFLFLIVYLLIKHSKYTVWIAFAVFFVSDIFSVLSFGIYLSAGTFSFLIMYWLYEDLFTNQSLWTVAALCSVGFVLFKTGILAGMLITREFIGLNLLRIYIIELISTTVAALFIFLFLITIFKKLNTQFAQT